MKVWAAVALGGALGACLRHGAGLLVAKGAWPWATLLVNLAGSFLLGFLAARYPKGAGLSPEAFKLWTTGFCGALTTYSTFNLELLELGRGAGGASALGYGLGTALGALACGALGLRVGGG